MRRTNLLIAAGLAVFVLGLPLGILLLLVPSEQNCGTSSAASPSAPPPGTQTAGQVVRYLESQGFAPFGAAGIEGNLQQESGLNPTESDGAGGGGLAQWKASWYQKMSAWATGHGLSPTSMAGQLEYLAFDVRSSYPQVVSELNSATSPQEAATMFETTYEFCSGYVAYMVVIPGSPCNDPNRRMYAVAAYTAAGGSSAAGTAVPVSLSSGSTCCPSVLPTSAQPVAGGSSSTPPAAIGGTCAVNVSYHGKDPIPGFSPGRDDSGVDACAKPGMPIYAPATSVLIQPVLQNWYGPQPLMLFEFVPPISGTYQGDEYWYVAEQITPVTQTVGTVFQAGQPVATFAGAGTCIEIGWGSPTTTMRALAPQYAHPAAGELTPVGETFKQFFGIPWVGQSP